MPPHEPTEPMETVDFFAAGSPFLDHPLLTAERTAREVDFVLSRANPPPGCRILDVGCGPGRHSIELARRGYQVVGIDPSAAMIAAARERSAEAGVAPEFLQVAGEDYTPESSFALAICLFTSLGQIGAGQDDGRLLAKVARALAPWGGFIVEVPQRHWVISHLKPSERFSRREGHTDIQRTYDPKSKTVSETFTVVSPHGQRRYQLRYRLYNQQQLIELLRGAGFQGIRGYGSYDGAPLDDDSPVIILLARRTG